MSGQQPWETSGNCPKRRNDPMKNKRSNPRLRTSEKGTDYKGREKYIDKHRKKKGTKNSTIKGKSKGEKSGGGKSILSLKRGRTKRCGVLEIK